jgi:hypothetical protein
MESIKSILIKRDGMDPADADDLISQAQKDFNELVENGDLEEAENICYDWFGLEPDYLIEFF